jgi:hypothetical protein
LHVLDAPSIIPGYWMPPCLCHLRLLGGCPPRRPFLMRAPAPILLPHTNRATTTTTLALVASRCVAASTSFDFMQRPPLLSHWTTHAERHTGQTISFIPPIVPLSPHAERGQLSHREELFPSAGPPWRPQPDPGQFDCSMGQKMLHCTSWMCQNRRNTCVRPVAAILSHTPALA